MLNSTLELVVSKDPLWRYEQIDFFGNLDSYSLKDKKVLLMGMVEKTDKEFLVFNFQNLNFINSESISLLLQINESLIKREKKLVIIDAKKNVLDVLNVIGIFQTMSYFRTIKEFLNSIK